MSLFSHAEADYPFVPSDVALYHRQRAGDGDTGIDDHTWDDMLLPRYSAQLAAGTSILGQQELHRRLHGGPAGQAAQAAAGERQAALAASATRVRTLVEEPARRLRLEQACAGLRRADREVSETLYGPAPAAAPRWCRCLPALPLAFLASTALALASGWLSLWLLALGLWLALMAVQTRYHEAAAEWGRVIHTLQQLLRAHSLLAKLDEPLAEGLRHDAAGAGKLNREIGRAPWIQMLGVSDYADWLFLMNIRHYFASQGSVGRARDFLRGSFERVAALEAELALARHLAGAARYCWAGHGAALSLEGAVHPLLADPAPLSFAPGARGAFISGQNGIGKSTLLRTVGLNLIVARAFGFCYAEAAVTPGLPVYSSMQNEDAMEGGESLYLAELRRAGELLALAERAPAIFIIDEIFRGTNHLESISASAAVLHALSASGRVMVSSHSLVLAPLLAASLAPWCVRRVDGKLVLAAGVLQETNGIALLAARGFDAAISARAGRVFDWLNHYLAHPADCAGVVDAPVAPERAA